MVQKGVRFPDTPANAFEPIWCAWGFGSHFQPKQILTALPVVKALGFKWVTMDDGWQNAEGDWLPNPEKFPHGDADVTALVDKIHEAIADGRWTPQRKAALRDSRLKPTRSLAAAIAAAATPPKVLISGSAVGYYGASDGTPKTEASPPGDDFLAHICIDWEAEARRAATTSTRVVLLRTGVVLERTGGALPEMMRPFRFFAGGAMGSGRQYVSWIHRLDWIEIVRWLIETPGVDGAVNAHFVGQ